MLFLPYTTTPRPPSFALLTLFIMMRWMVSLGVSQMAVAMMIGVIMMMLRRSLEARVVGGELLQALARWHIWHYYCHFF